MAPLSPQFDVSTVVSILPITLNEEKPGLQPPYFTIPACKDPRTTCTTLAVSRSRFSVYIDMSRPSIIVPEPSDIIAESICRDYKISVSHYSPDVAEPGLFWVKGDLSPSEIMASKEIAPQLARARGMQNTWFTFLVAEADDSWGKNHMRRMISNLQRIAAVELGLTREWDIELEVEQSEKPLACKFCRAMIHPASIICMHCRGVLDLAAFKQNFVSADAPRA